ncbi:PIN domain-containing protein [Streptomyces sp. NPDC055078]
MIILDSCTLRSVGLGSGLDLLHTIKASGVAVGVPWIVVEELAAQKSLEYTKAHEAAERALEVLRKATPWAAESGRTKETDKVREHWRAYYGRLGTVIRSSQEVMEEAIRREANVIPPCKQAGPEKKPFKIGGRDAAIWLTAVEYARANPEETVYFVSSNITDFGDGSSYEPPMDQDLDGLGDRFRHLTSFDDVVAEFAQPTSVDMDTVVEICEQPEVQQAVRAYSFRHWTFGAHIFSQGFEATTITGANTTRTTRAQGWIDPHRVVVRRLSTDKITGYHIGDAVWVTAEVAWELSGYVLEGDDQLVWVATRLDTSLLLSVGGTSNPAAILRSSPPRAVDADLVDIPAQRAEEEKLCPTFAAMLTDPERTLDDWLSTNPEGKWFSSRQHRELLFAAIASHVLATRKR